MISQNSTTTRGSALLLVLCAIAVMSLTVLTLVEWTDLGLTEAAIKGKDFRALQLAESGLAMGLHPRVEKLDSVLNKKITPSEGFTVHIGSEEGRLDINSVLTNGESEILEDLFTRWGVKSRDRSVLIDSLLDWVDKDSFTHTNGAELRNYEARGLRGFPSNRPFRNIQEIEKVNGIEALNEAKPDWKNYFTVWGSGKLDLNEAPADLIAAVCGVGSLAAETFVERRLGADGKQDTEDDYIYEDLERARNALGLSASAFRAIEENLTLKGEFRRVESTGQVGPYTRKISIVFKLNTKPIQYLLWNES